MDINQLCQKKLANNICCYGETQPDSQKQEMANEREPYPHGDGKKEKG